MEAQGNKAEKISLREARVCEVTVDTICQTVG
jgi:hypothetical protein